MFSYDQTGYNNSKKLMKLKEFLSTNSFSFINFFHKFINPRKIRNILPCDAGIRGGGGGGGITIEGGGNGRGFGVGLVVQLLQVTQIGLKAHPSCTQTQTRHWYIGDQIVCIS